MAKQEIKAGVFTLSALGILSLFLIFISGYTPWRQDVAYRTRFRMAIGLNPGSPVQMNGVAVGQVKKVFLVDELGLVEVVFGLKKEVKPRRGVTAELASQGLIGDTFLLLTQRDPKGEVLPPGSLIRSIEKLDIAQALSAVSRLAANAETSLDKITGRMDAILSDIQRVVNAERMDHLARKWGQWEGRITDTLESMAAMSARMDKMMVDLKGIVDQVEVALKEDQKEVKDILDSVQTQLEVTGGAIIRLRRTLEAAIVDTQAKAAQLIDQGQTALDEDQAKVSAILDSSQKIVDNVDKVSQKTTRAADISLEEIVAITQNLAEASRHLLALSLRLRDEPSLILRQAGTK